ncbi:N-acetyltransferase [Candidatus Woesearchaeota archaeon]|nr:MAG: N-acetyltransferase [Candidatus Woesearchaeota archaeon]
MSDIAITVIKAEEDLIDLISLKQACDELYVGPISEDSALHKLLNMNAYSDFYVARRGQQPIGYVQGNAVGEAYYSEEMYVMPEFRRQGCASALIKAQIEFARKSGLKTVQTVLSKENSTGIKLYEQCGFQCAAHSDTMLTLAYGIS